MKREIKNSLLAREKSAIKVFGNHDNPLIKFQNEIRRCLFSIRASGVRSHLCSTGVIMQKQSKKKVNIDGMFGLLSGDSI